MNTVFQDYAIFPHMDVLDERRVRPAGQEGRPRASADAGPRRRWPRSGSRGTASAGPNQLSGGQRQRVALARALVNRPKVLLLDEPLGALDLKLRREMQLELKQIQRDVGITFVFVTHDQEEALTMSDRIAVFNDGRVEQVATPVELYEQPGQLVRRRLRRHLQPARGRRRRASCSAAPGQFAVRPEKLRAAPRPATPVDAGERRAARAWCARSSTSAPITHAVVELDAGARLTVLAPEHRTAPPTPPLDGVATDRSPWRSTATH